MNFYGTVAWQKARSVAQKRWKAANLPCGVCGARLRWGEKKAVIVDHIKPRRKFPQLAYEQSNLQCVCHTCNTKKAVWGDNSDVTPTGLSGFPPGWD